MITNELTQRREVVKPSPETTFSKGLVRRMRSTFDQSRLTIIGGKFDGQRTQSRHFLPGFLGADNVTTSDGLSQARFNAALPHVTGVLLGTARAHDTYLEGVGGGDLENVSKIAINLATDRGENSTTVVRVVYGATREMPARALSYPLPALVMMEELQGNGDKEFQVKPPQLQIVFATHTSSSLNGITHEEAAHQARILAEVQRKYIADHFPNLVDHVLFLEDIPASQNGSDREVSHLAHALEIHGDEELIVSLQQKGDVFDRSTSLAYGAAHVLFHDAAPAKLLVPLFADQEEMVTPEAIINVGGRQEQDFYAVRQIIKDSVHDDVPLVASMQLFTKHHVPPYYMARGGDIPLEPFILGADITSFPTTNAAERDLRYLQEVTRSRIGAFV